jgi:hypothetical protein
MRMRMNKTLRTMAQWTGRILEIQLPIRAIYGLRTR